MSLQSRTFEIGPGACRYEDNFLVETPLRCQRMARRRGLLYVLFFFALSFLAITWQLARLPLHTRASLPVNA
jgi:hypothetical protein